MPILKVGHLNDIWLDGISLFVGTVKVGMKASQSFKMFPLQQYMRPGLPYNCHCLFYPEPVNLDMVSKSKASM